MTTAPDFAPITLRRIVVMEDRQEAIFNALYIALFTIFLALMYALYTVREDLLKAMEK